MEMESSIYQIFQYCYTGGQDDKIQNSKIKMQNENSKFKIIIILIAVFALLVPFAAFGAILYFEPVSGEFYQGDTFGVNLKIDTEKDCINTVKGEIEFSKDVLEVVNFITGNSILTIWLQSPKLDQNSGKISFVGGIPGGYCGPLPGEPGELGLLLKIFFKTKKEGTANLKFLKESQVLLNDGFGTPAKLNLKEAEFKILPEKREIPKEEWQEELKKDNIPPEPFEIEIHKDPAIFEGKYFIVFSTTDKQTGIDHYEVLETREKRQENWKKAESPYLLEDQSLRSIIKVKAVDKAGNERIAEYLPLKKPFPWRMIVLILVLAGIIWWLIRKIKPQRPKTRM